MNDYVDAARRLHHFLLERFWTGTALVGPDFGVRLNARFLRFVKSYLGFLPWADNRYYMQAQGYWVLANWKSFDLLGEQIMADTATRCAFGVLESQQPSGYWEYPNGGWEGRIVTVETVWAAMGLLVCYERTGDRALLEGAIRAYRFLEEQAGFQQAGQGKAINYFANRPRGPVPNNATLALMLFGKLAEVTADDQYLAHCPEMIAFLDSVQLPTGELPYEVESPLGKGTVHYQCFQYHGFQLADLTMYYESTHDAAVVPMMSKIVQFLAPSVKTDGSTWFDCANDHVERIYNTAAIASALSTARRLGLHNNRDAEDRAFAYVLAQQDNTGGFPFSRREYRFFKDRRYYPRPLAMMLYQVAVKGLAEMPRPSKATMPVSERIRSQQGNHV